MPSEEHYNGQVGIVVVITKDIYRRYVECTYVAKINALGKTLH